jgi:hypothetical protein
MASLYGEQADGKRLVLVSIPDHRTGVQLAGREWKSTTEERTQPLQKNPRAGQPSRIGKKLRGWQWQPALVCKQERVRPPSRQDVDVGEARQVSRAVPPQGSFHRASKRRRLEVGHQPGAARWPRARSLPVRRQKCCGLKLAGKSTLKERIERNSVRKHGWRRGRVEKAN